MKALRPESIGGDGLVGVAGRPGNVGGSSTSTIRLLRLRGRSYSTDGSGVSDTNGASTGCSGVGCRTTAGGLGVADLECKCSEILRSCGNGVVGTAGVFLKDEGKEGGGALVFSSPLVTSPSPSLVLSASLLSIACLAADLSPPPKVLFLANFTEGGGVGEGEGKDES